MGVVQLTKYYFRRLREIREKARLDYEYYLQCREDYENGIDEDPNEAARTAWRDREWTASQPNYTGD